MDAIPVDAPFAAITIAPEADAHAIDEMFRMVHDLHSTICNDLQLEFDLEMVYFTIENNVAREHPARIRHKTSIFMYFKCIGCGKIVQAHDNPNMETSYVCDDCALHSFQKIR